MKKIPDWLLELLLALFFCSSLAAETIVITTGEYIPDYSKNYMHYGLTPHIVTEAFALEGVKVEWQFMPWARAMHLAQNGHVDASCCWAKNKERQENFLYSDPIQSRYSVFFHLKSFKFNWETIKDLESTTIGGVIGYTYGNALDRAEKAGKLTFYRAHSEKQGFNLLLLGRISLFVGDKRTGYSMLSDFFETEKVKLITHHPKATKIYHNHLIISKKHEKNEQLLNLFNRGLKKLKEIGKYDQFIEEAQRGDYIIKK